MRARDVYYTQTTNAKACMRIIHTITPCNRRGGARCFLVNSSTYGGTSSHPHPFLPSISSSADAREPKWHAHGGSPWEARLLDAPRRLGLLEIAEVA